MRAVMTKTPLESFRVAKSRIACDGTGDGTVDPALGHPRVWLEIDPDLGDGAPTASV
jgi:uncharacterized Zn-finger protein